MDIKIATWNILLGKNLDSIIAGLKEIKADIIALQETAQFKNGTDITQFIAEELGYEYFFCKTGTFNQSGNEYAMGNAIVSRYPILNAACIPLNKKTIYDGTPASEYRCACSVHIRVGTINLHVCSTHVYAPHDGQKSRETEVQFTSLSSLAEGRMILMGDFNTDGANSEFSLLEKKLTQVSLDTAPTFVNLKYDPNEKRRFDHIFVSKEFQVKGHKVHQVEGSDHLPVSAEVSI